MAEFDDHDWDDSGDHTGPHPPREKLLSKLTRRLQNPRELGGDAKDLLGSVLETSDRARTEMTRLVVREVRTYLEELKLKEAIGELVTSHSLDIHLSMALKPLHPQKRENPASGEPESTDGTSEPPESSS